MNEFPELKTTPRRRRRKRSIAPLILGGFAATAIVCCVGIVIFVAISRSDSVVEKMVVNTPPNNQSSLQRKIEEFFKSRGLTQITLNRWRQKKYKKDQIQAIFLIRYKDSFGDGPTINPEAFFKSNITAYFSNDGEIVQVWDKHEPIYSTDSISTPASSFKDALDRAIRNE